MSPVPKPIEALKVAHEALASRLSEWSAINSGSRNLAGLELMRKTLAEAFARLPGVTVTVIRGHASEASLLSVRCRPEAPTQVLLSGHYDTVFAPDHPFQKPLRKSAETLVGPGVSDMKGGLLVMLAALTAFEETGATGQVGWEALLTPDEEIGSHASAPTLLETARRHHLGLIFEPARASGDLVRSRMGSGNFRILCHGRAAHAGHVPNPGRNAITALSGIIVALSELPRREPTILLNPGRIAGGGPVNVVPDFAEAEFNIRTTRKADEEIVKRALADAAGTVNAREGFRVEVLGGFDCPPMEADTTTERVFADWKICAQDLGLGSFDWIHTGGASDANLLASAGLPCLDGLGPIGGALHTDGEYCVVASLAERAALAALFLHRLDRGAFSLSRAEG